MVPDRHPISQLEAGLAGVRQSPRGVGTLELIVRRPAVDAREVLVQAALGPRTGLVGDSWIQRSSSLTPNGSPNPGRQLTVVNSRFVQLIAGTDRAAWALSGDQLYVDLDLSVEALPAGSRLTIGDRAAIEVTDQQRTGCAKFADRFGVDAHRIVGTEDGRWLRLRGFSARVVAAGTIRLGDAVRVQPA